MRRDTTKHLNDDERLAMASHINEGYLQAKRGELIDAEVARKEIEVMKSTWRSIRQ